MADIPESDILNLIRSRVEAKAVEEVFEASLVRAGIERKPLYDPAEVIAIGQAMTTASFELLQDTLTKQGFVVDD